jgi:hypothetical protein
MSILLKEEEAPTVSSVNCCFYFGPGHAARPRHSKIRYKMI